MLSKVTVYNFFEIYVWLNFVDKENVSPLTICKILQKVRCYFN